MLPIIDVIFSSAVESLKTGDILLHYFDHVIGAVNKRDSKLGQQLAKLRPGQPFFRKSSTKCIF